MELEMEKVGDEGCGEHDAEDMALIGVMCAAGLESIGLQSAKVERGLIDLMVEAGARHAALSGGRSVGEILGLQDPVLATATLKYLCEACALAREATSTEVVAEHLVPAVMRTIATMDPARFAKSEFDTAWRAALDETTGEVVSAFETIRAGSTR
jgi:hypothetical protein